MNEEEFREKLSDYAKRAKLRAREVLEVGDAKVDRIDDVIDSLEVMVIAASRLRELSETEAVNEFVDGMMTILEMFHGE